MFIIEQKYGNDGYSFWFKLLEHLGSTDGHCINFNDVLEREFLVSRTKLNENMCIEILSLLAKLDAIDGALWSDGFIWSQNFVDGLIPLYQKRRTEIPIRPNFLPENHKTELVFEEKTHQSRVKESKVKERKEEETDLSPEAGDHSPVGGHVFCKRDGKRVEGVLHGKNVIITADEYQRMIDDWGKKFTDDSITEYDERYPNSKAIRSHTDHNLGIRDYVRRGYICQGKQPHIKNGGFPDHMLLQPRPTEEEIGTPDERVSLLRDNLTPEIIGKSGP